MRHLAHHRRYVNSVMRGLVATLCERAVTQQESEQARHKLIEAVKQRKVLDKLRDRRRGEWLKEQDKVEINELDEMGLAAIRRREEAGS
jgi:flagellar FliJ protein